MRVSAVPPRSKTADWADEPALSLGHPAYAPGMEKYRVACFWFEVEASSADDAAERVRDLPPTASWIRPDPSERYDRESDPVLAEAVWLLDEWATVATDPTGDLVDNSRAVAAQLRDRLTTHVE